MSDKVYWEDMEVGRTMPLGAYHVSREEIIEFATEFDPQPFHLDDEAAKLTPLGGLAASGWHSCSILMRMICDTFLSNSSSLGSPGIDEVAWKRPVRPGDTLAGRYTCNEARVSRSRPEIGVCKIHYEVFNQRDELVMTWLSTQFFGRRGDESAR